MKLTPIRTKKIIDGQCQFEDFFDTYIPKLQEKSILAVTSKVVSILEQNTLKKKGINKDELIHKESDLYLPKQKNIWGLTLTIKNNTLIPSAGIDESNANNTYVLWPKKPFASATRIWKFLKKKYNLQYLGVIITDSKTTPLRWGTTGISIAFCGFHGLNNYIGKKDIFGRKLSFTKANIADGFAAAAVVQMGEGKEQTPLVILDDLPFVRFVKKPPAQKEVKKFFIDLKDDIYNQIFSLVRWKKGGLK